MSMLSILSGCQISQIRTTGETVTIRNQQGTCSPKALFGRTKFTIDDGDRGVRLEWSDRDFIIVAADLTLGLPERGWKIVWTDSGIVHTFEIVPFGSEPHFRYSGPSMKVLRIHTKLIESRAV